jgi:hypothetical protein
VLPVRFPSLVARIRQISGTHIGCNWRELLYVGIGDTFGLVRHYHID